MRYASQKQLARLTASTPAQIDGWLKQTQGMSTATQRRWRSRLRLNKTALAALLELMVTDAKTRRLYRHEVAAMIRQERPVHFSHQHFFYARPSQLAELTNLHPTQFTAWFNTPKALPGRTTRRLLIAALAMSEADLIKAFYNRQQYAAKVKHERCLIDRYLTEQAW